MNILILNAGSSSLKFQVTATDLERIRQQTDQRLCRGQVERMRLAIEIFCYRARKYIGALLACAGGADAVVFTGGIGENSSTIRARIREGMQWAGLTLDQERNQETMGREGQISTAESNLHAWVIPTDEELLIARDTVRCILGEPHPS